MMAPKAPPWPKTDRPWSRLSIDFAGRRKSQYYSIVVDNFSKWPEVMKCKNSTSSGTIRFLHEFFARFDIPDCVGQWHTIPDNHTHHYRTISPTT